MAECARQLVSEPYLVLLNDVRSSSHYVRSLKIFFNSFSAHINQLPSCFVLYLSSCVCIVRIDIIDTLYCAFEMFQLKRYIYILTDWECHYLLTVTLPICIPILIKGRLDEYNNYYTWYSPAPCSKDSEGDTGTKSPSTTGSTFGKFPEAMNVPIIPQKSSMCGPNSSRQLTRSRVL